MGFFSGKRVEEPELDWTWPTTASSKADTPQIEASSQYVAPPTGSFDGNTFWNGITGYIDEIADLDYWALRRRSAALFHSNMYARGMLRRFVTNVIHIGMKPEWRLNHSILGITKEHAKKLSKQLEQRYDLFSASCDIIDAKAMRTEGDLQAQIYLEALINGDCLVICRQDPDTDLPQLQIVNGDRVQTPMEFSMDPKVVDGVRLDKRGRHLGYYVYQGTNDIHDDRFVYVRARGIKSGRKTAWMVYGCDKREDGVRGEPILGIVMQGLNDVNGFKGSALLRAKMSAALVGAVENTTGAPSSLPLERAASRTKTVNTDPVTGKNLKIQEMSPGMFLTTMSHGEKVTFNTIGSDVNFGPFEAAMVLGMAWALEIPPEILMLSFNKAFNASQAGLNEWTMFLTKARQRFAGEHCQNLAEEFQIAEALSGKLKLPGFIESYDRNDLYDIKAAWLKIEWIGTVKPTTDPQRQGKGFELQVKNGWNTHGRIARVTNGTKFEDNVEILKEENQLLADAMRPLLELQREFGSGNVDQAVKTASVALLKDKGAAA